MTSSYQALVLAAGRGSRFGGGKLTADWRGAPMIAASTRIALAAAVEEVIVVTGCDAQGVEAALQPLACDRLRTVFAADWAAGLSASLRVGLRSLPAGSDGLLLFLGDMPMVPAALAAEVLQAMQTGAVAVQPCFEDRPAHPVGLSSAYYPSLLSLEGDAGAGKLLAGDHRVVRLPTLDPGAAFDVDVPERR